MKKVSAFNVRQGPNGRYVPASKEERVAVMDNGTTRVTFSTQASLVSASRSPEEPDTWSVLVSADPGPNGKPAAEATKFSYTSGTGCRAVDNNGDQHPAEPAAREVLQALALDVRTALELPRSEIKQMEYLRDELGFSDPVQAIRVLRGVTASHDKIEEMLPRGAGVEDFSAWGRELEMFPLAREPGRVGVDLPLAGPDEDGRTWRGAVSIGFGRTTSDKRGTDLSVVGAGATKFTISGSIGFREGSEKFFSPDQSGQCVDMIAETWSSFPEVVELCGLWKRWANNELNAGTAAQRDFLSENYPGNVSWDDQLKALKAAGLEPDTSVEGQSYSYGSSWLIEVIPDDVLARLRELVAKVGDLSRSAVAEAASSGPRR